MQRKYIGLFSEIVYYEYSNIFYQEVPTIFIVDMAGPGLADDFGWFSSAVQLVNIMGVRVGGVKTIVRVWVRVREGADLGCRVGERGGVGHKKMQQEDWQRILIKSNNKLWLVMVPTVMMLALTWDLTTHGRPEQILTGESWNPAHNFLYSWETIQFSGDVESWLEDQDSEAIHYTR